MSEWEHAYICIDLKSSYASVECTDRGLDPFSTDLVVADPERSANTICLAITPSMKAKGARNRCRVRDIPVGMEYITAVPSMRRYMKVSVEIYREYLRYVCAEDTRPYSVDERFIDATPYLRRYGLSTRAFAGRLIVAVRGRTGIAATAGIGPNMFLAKVALDVTAKHADDGIGELDEESFWREVWLHRPIADIWGIGHGIAGRLARRGIYDLAGVCAERPEVIRSMFGKSGEVLVDHAWGLEPATIADCRSYVPKARLLSNGQALMRDYRFEEARTVAREMVYGSCMDLAGGCSPATPWGSGWATRARSRAAPIRRVNIALMGVVPTRMATPTLFDDIEADVREERLTRAAVAVRRRFGPNALLRGTSLRPGANARERNLQVGGNRA